MFPIHVCEFHVGVLGDVSIKCTHLELVKQFTNSGLLQVGKPKSGETFFFNFWELSSWFQVRVNSGQGIKVE